MKRGMRECCCARSYDRRRDARLSLSSSNAVGMIILWLIETVLYDAAAILGSQANRKYTGRDELRPEHYLQMQDSIGSGLVSLHAARQRLRRAVGNDVRRLTLKRAEAGGANKLGLQSPGPDFVHSPHLLRPGSLGRGAALPYHIFRQGCARVLRHCAIDLLLFASHRKNFVHRRIQLLQPREDVSAALFADGPAGVASSV